jgi:hypothetical protein
VPCDAGKIPIWNLRPLVEHLKSSGSKLGFSASSNPRKWKAVQDDVLVLHGEKGREVQFYQLLTILAIRSIDMQPITMQDFAGPPPLCPRPPRALATARAQSHTVPRL